MICRTTCTKTASLARTEMLLYRHPTVLRTHYLYKAANCVITSHHSKLANLLSNAGYNVTLMENCLHVSSGDNKIVAEAAIRADGLHPVLQPVLRITSQYIPFQITIRPAHPSNTFRWLLMKAYCERPDVAFLVPMFRRYVLSWGLDSFTLETCIFLVIVYIHVSGFFGRFQGIN